MLNFLRLPATRSSFYQFSLNFKCGVPGNIHTNPLPPTEGISISWGWGWDSRNKQHQKKQLKKHRKLNCNFQRGGGELRKNSLSVGEVWVISRATQYIGLEETSAPYCWLMFCTVQQVRTI